MVFAFLIFAFLFIFIFTSLHESEEVYKPGRYPEEKKDDREPGKRMQILVDEPPDAKTDERGDDKLYTDLAGIEDLSPLGLSHVMIIP